MLSDSELIRQYVDHHDEAAFAELVRRNLQMVYYAALRQMGGEAHLAEDVAQSVFTQLARQARSLVNHATLAGWLHTTTRYLALNAVRAQRRRQIREQEAVAMHEQNSAPAPDLNLLSAALDEAVSKLPETDRNVLLLRYFQNKSHREVAATLGLSENAANKRVDRALDKVRLHFARGGVTTSAALLATALNSQAALPLPVYLSANVVSVSLSSTAAVGGLGYTAWQAFFMTTSNKIIVATATVAVLIAVLFTLQQYKNNDPQKKMEQLPSVVVAQKSPAKSIPVQSVKSSAFVVAPALPPTPASQSNTSLALNPTPPKDPAVIKKAITNNLRQFAYAAKQRMIDQHVTEASYYDIVGTGSEAYVRSIAPVAGEDYTGIIFHQGDTQIKIIGSDGVTYTYDM